MFYRIQGFGQEVHAGSKADAVYAAREIAQFGLDASGAWPLVEIFCVKIDGNGVHRESKAAEIRDGQLWLTPAWGKRRASGYGSAKTHLAAKKRRLH